MAYSSPYPAFLPAPRLAASQVSFPNHEASREDFPPSAAPARPPATAMSSSPAAESAEETATETRHKIPPPPEQSYLNPTLADEGLRAWAKTQRYELVRTKSDKNTKGDVYKLYYKCSKHGKITNTRRLTEETRQRSMRRTKRSGCPMGLVVKATDPKNVDGEWQIRHQQNGKSLYHNHLPGAHEDGKTRRKKKAPAELESFSVNRPRNHLTAANGNRDLLHPVGHNAVDSWQDGNTNRNQERHKQLEAHIEAIFRKMVSEGKFSDIGVSVSNNVIQQSGWR